MALANALEASVWRRQGAPGVQERSDGARLSRNTGEVVQQGPKSLIRYDRRHTVRSLANWAFARDGLRSCFDGVSRCGFAMGAEVTLKSDGHSTWPSGVRSCGLVWSCPVCAAKIKSRRAVELEAATRLHVERGGSLSMMTATVRHDSSMSLVDVRSAVAGSWRKLQRRKSWLAIRELLEGQVVAPEVTVGVNGWHPHLHILMFIRSGVLQSEIDVLVGRVVDDWRALVTEALGVSPSIERGVHVLHFGINAEAAAARYLSKVAKELTGGDLKSGRDPFSLLDDVAQGDAQAIARWFEFTAAMKGRQSLSWSKGLRSRLGLDELTDEEIADGDLDLGLVVAVVDGASWDRIVASGAVRQTLLRQQALVERFGLAALADHVT